MRSGGRNLPGPSARPVTHFVELLWAIVILDAIFLGLLIAYLFKRLK